MSAIDYIVLVLTLAGIVAYGVYKSRSSRDIEGYFLGNRSMPWFLVLLSIMGTQASAITSVGARTSLQRRDAFCAVLLWLAARDDCD